MVMNFKRPGEPDDYQWFHEQSWMYYHTDPNGDGYGLMLYGIRDMNSPVLAPRDWSIWGSQVDTMDFCLFDDIWPVRVDLYEIYFPHMPPDLDSVIKTALADFLSQGAVLAFFMFDFTFGSIDEFLESEHEARGTYGIAFPGQAPVTALSEALRQEPAWGEIARAASRHLYTVYPELRTLYAR
jgi:hypothetical protein